MKRLLSILLIVAVITSIGIPVNAKNYGSLVKYEGNTWCYVNEYGEEEYFITIKGKMEGKTGSCKWKFYPDKMMLKISGNGEMPNYDLNKRPWEFLSEFVMQVTIEKGVTSIGEGSFLGFDIETIKIPSTVKKIGCYAFGFCNKLKNLSIPNSITTIGDCAFESCSSLKNVRIGKGLKTLQERTFYDCTSLKTVRTGVNLKQIGTQAFLDCEKLNKITLGKKVRKISPDCFEGCSKLKKINVSKKNKKYCSKAGVLFNKNRTKLVIYPAGGAKIYKVPSTVKTIGKESFLTSKIRKITITNKVKKIKTGAFSGCQSLTKVKLPKSLRTIEESAFQGCKKLKSVLMNPGIKTIGFRAFEGCKNLAKGKNGIKIPDSVTRIDLWAFQDCKNIKEVILSKNLPYLSSEAFLGCNKLKRATVYAKTKLGKYSLGYKDAGEWWKIKGFVIKGKKGSNAQKYAKNNRFKFVAI